jgi:hypothetical protein
LNVSADGERPSDRHAIAPDDARDAIRKDAERAEEIAHMQKLIDEAYAGGFVETTMEEIWREVVGEFEWEGGRDWRLSRAVKEGIRQWPLRTNCQY